MAQKAADGLVYESPDEWIIKYRDAKGEVHETEIYAETSYEAYKECKKLPDCKLIIWVGPKTAGDLNNVELRLDV